MQKIGKNEMKINCNNSPCKVVHSYMTKENVKIEPVHISQISAGDTIVHDDKLTTVSGNNIKRDSFMGITLFGDSYRSGTKPVNKVVALIGKNGLIQIK